ncbi:DUF7832 domain-containing protein [Corallococcus sp. M7]
MAYDKATWHYEGEYPTGLSKQRAFVHTGMFIAWAITRGMASEGIPARQQRAVRARKMTGARVYAKADGVFAASMLTREGQKFAADYYAEMFNKDQEKLLAGKLPSEYHVKDTWKNLDVVLKRIDGRFAK